MRQNGKYDCTDHRHACDSWGAAELVLHISSTAKSHGLPTLPASSRSSSTPTACGCRLGASAACGIVRSMAATLSARRCAWTFRIACSIQVTQAVMSQCRYGAPRGLPCQTWPPPPCSHVSCVRIHPSQQALFYFQLMTSSASSRRPAVNQCSATSWPATPPC